MPRHFGKTKRVQNSPQKFYASFFLFLFDLLFFFWGRFQKEKRKMFRFPFFLFLFISLSTVGFARGTIYNYYDLGGVPDDDSIDTEDNNGALMNQTLSLLQPGDTLYIPEMTFYLMGGIIANNLKNVTIQLDGVLYFSNHTRKWPKKEGGNVLDCLEFDNVEQLTLTSSSIGSLNGNGNEWWGKPGIGYAIHGENRPKLLHIHQGEDILIENWTFINSPYWTTWLESINGMEIRHCKIDARRDNSKNHSLYDLSAFNTDGFDVSGYNIWVHDCEVYNQDDSFCVKGNSGNITFERISSSGLGLTIGSIGSETVRNVTFRDAYMPYTVKGIYLKFNGGGNGLIEDITYENIYMKEPSQYPIWIGPAQQSDSTDPCSPNPCSLCWPTVPDSQCNMPAGSQFRNIVLRNITVSSPAGSPGVLFGRDDLPMENILFENVIIENPGTNPFGTNYYCQGVDQSTSIASGKTTPVPECFTNKDF